MIAPPSPPSAEGKGVPPSVLPEQTLQAMLDEFQQFIPGMIKTLGMAAQPVEHEDGTITPGDLEAAKKALDFLGKAMAGTKAEGRGAEVLRRIAELRAADDSEY